MGIGVVLQSRRAVMGLSITDAARLAGIPRAYLSMIEAGKRLPNAPILLHLMTALGVEPPIWVTEYLSDEVSCSHMINMAQALFEAGHLSEARQVLGKAYFSSTRDFGGRYNADIYYRLGRIYYAQGKTKRAARWFQRMERATRHAPPSHLQGVAAYNNAQALARIGNRLEALKKFDLAIENFSKFRKRTELGTAWLAKANLLLGIRLYPEAHEAYRRAAFFLRKGTPMYGDAAMGEAITLAVLEGPERALAILEQVVDDYRDSKVVFAKALGNLATVLREIGEYEQAIQSLLTALELPTDNLPVAFPSAVLTELTLCYLETGDRDSALEAFRRCIDAGGPYDGADIAAMHVVAAVLQEDPPAKDVPVIIQEDFEQRVRAALRLLRRYRVMSTP